MMVKTFLSILSMLILACGSMLFWQWQVFSEKQENQDDSQVYIEQQTYTVVHKNDTMAIEQTIKGLPAGEYMIVNQNNLVWSCSEENKDECTKENILGGKISAKGKDITLYYTLPRESKESSFLLTGFGLKIKDSVIGKSRVEITEKEARNGDWAAGAPLIGKTEKDYINYYVFEQDGDLFPLYYHNEKMAYIKANEDITVYTETNQKLDGKQVSDSVGEMFQNKELTFVLTDKHPEYISNNFIITSNLAEVDKKLTAGFIKMSYPFENPEESWLQGLIGVLALDQLSPSKKVNDMYNELKGGLTEEQLQQFIRAVEDNKGNKFSASLLDRYLAEVSGWKTEFFTINKHEKTAVLPLFFMNDKKLLVNQKEWEKQNVIYYQSQKFFDFRGFAHAFAYEYSQVGKDQILLTKDSNMHRFYLNQNTFLYNEKAFSSANNPLIILNGRFYISEASLMEIFKVFVRQTESQLELVGI